MSVTTRVLSRAKGKHDRLIFLPVTLAFEGDADPGVNWICHKCGRVLLAGVWERQFLDLYVRCSECGALGALPNRVPGEPLPGMSLLAPPGRSLLGSPVDVRGKPVLMAGQSAFDAYKRETGANYSGQPQPGFAGKQSLDAQMLRTMGRQAIRLLGRHYKSLAETDASGLKSKTPPARRHRLIELIRYSELAAEMLAKQPPSEPVTLDADALSELLTTLALFKRWRNHPLFPSLRDSLANPKEVQHTVMTLGIASMLVDAGNGVGLIDHRGSRHPVPDLWLVPRIIERLEIEVKTPLALRSPGPGGLKTDAIRLVTDIVDAAAGTKGGQLNPEHSGIVAIGSFHLGEKGLDQLETAVRNVLGSQAKAKRKPHLIAVVVFEVTYQVTTFLDPSGALISTGFSPAISNRLVKHPAYGGALTIQQAPWQLWPGSTDAPLPPGPSASVGQPAATPNPVGLTSPQGGRYPDHVAERTRTYRDRVIRIAEVAGERGVIENARFIGCDVKGPAVLILKDSTLRHSNLGGPTADAVLWEIPPTRPVIVGAILVQACVFERCTFMNVGFAGPREMIAKMRAEATGS
jgi:hypothetical protein